MLGAAPQRRLRVFCRDSGFCDYFVTTTQTAGVLSAHDHRRDSLAKLAVGAIGVVYGDIGTSPLYAMKEVFVGHHPLTVDQLHIFGVVSLVFWSLVLIVTFKYVMVILRADNEGEG
ncbi:MAG: KUP/HAK/KT family potassium transporter, partial [Sphingomonas sp.]|nr:KUP/HAK/KT family potassium transporter [Sphingomonas sp.]